MSSWSTLSRSLVQLETEVRSGKPAVRYKALERLKSLLDTRADELVQLFQGRMYVPETTWLSLVDSVHEACVQQTSRLEESQDGKGLSAAEAKNRDHIAVLQKLIVLANRERTNIKHGSLLAKAFHCFGNRWMLRYFGTCYLQVLYENVLQDVEAPNGSTRDGLEEVKQGEWSRLLSHCFHMIDSVHIQRLTLLQCMPPIIEHGCYYTYLSADLVQYLPRIETIMATCKPEVNALGELIRLIFLICSNLALDYRLTVCQHLETILDAVIDSYSSRMSDRAKRNLFQLLHLAIAVHSPEGNVCAATSASYTANSSVWHRHQRSMMHLLHTEIQQQHSELTRLQTNPRPCPVFGALGASLCAVMFWNGSVWSDSNDSATASDGEPTPKRQRRPERLSGVMDAVESQPGKFCWRWMAILAELLTAYPSSLEAADFQPLLHMLHQFQLAIQYPVEVEILGQLTDILLRAEAQLVSTSDRIDAAFCDDLWYKIAQTAFRTTSAKLQQANVDLMRLLVVHKRCLPDIFLTTVLRTFLSEAIRRSNAAVRLLIAIWRHNNIDALDQADSKEMRYDTMAWLHRQKISLVNTERIDPVLVAELTVLCVLTKIDATVVERLDVADSELSVAVIGRDFTTFLRDLKRNLLLKSLRKLIIAQRIHGAHNSPSLRFGVLPQANNLLSVIDEQHFEHLFEILNPDREIPEHQDSLIPFNAVTGTLILYLHLLDRLIAYAALDRERLDKTFLAKKCTFKLEQLEMCVAKFRQNHSFGVKDTMDVLDRLRAIFETPLHPMLVAMMRSRELAELIAWLRRWLGERQRNSRAVFLRTVDQLNDANQLRYEAFAALAHLAEGANQQAAFAALDEFEFNLRNNTDMLIVLRLLGILMRQRTSAEKAEWCFGHVKELCQNYYRNQQLTEVLVDLLPDLVRYIHPYATMTDDLVQLLVSFMALAKKRKYGQHITEKLIRSLISVASAYPSHIVNDDMAAMYLVLNRFSGAAQPLRIQYATIETLSYILDVDWLRSFSPHTSEMVVSLTPFQRSMFDVLSASLAGDGLSTTVANATAITDDACGDIDRTSRIIGARVQYLCTVIAVSPLLRPLAWFQLMEFCKQQELSAEYMGDVLRQLCAFMVVDRAVFVAENMPRLLPQWLQADHPVDSFPWFVDPGAQSLVAFCRMHRGLWVLSILKWRPAALAGFGRLVEVTSVGELLEPIIAECLAFLLPFYAQCSNMAVTYTEHAQAMATVLERNITDVSVDWRTRTLEIVKHLLCHTWDAKQFNKWFQFELVVECDEHMANVATFDKCLAYVQSKTISTPASSLLLHFCTGDPYKMFQLVQHMKLTVQRARLVDQQLIAVYQYAVLVHHILEFLVRETLSTGVQKVASENVKLFFARDICNYLCNLLAYTSKPSTFTLAVLELLHTSCVLLLPKRVQYIRMHFHSIVSALLTVAAKTSPDVTGDNTARPPMSATIFAAALRCLRFLIVDQQAALSAEIALLDNFPTQPPAFDELREAHAAIKYRRKEFTLCDELECFLKVEHRNTEGLAALREQLAVKKPELAAVYRQHADRALEVANAKSSSLHRLVVSLLQTVKSPDEATDSTVNGRRLEAAKCLGELGPSDLSTLVLQPDSQMHTYKFFATFDGATKHFCRIVLGALNELLWHTDVDIMQAASEALVFLLEHKSAQEVDSSPYLSLFHATAPRSSAIYVTPPSAVGLKLESIFAEHMKSEHSVWIKAVVRELFTFFGDQTLRKVAAIHTPFAECALPLLVQMLLTCSLPDVMEGLRQAVIGFFDVHQTSRTTISNGGPRPLCLNWASIKAMLNVVECIRMYNLYNHNQIIQLNYLHVATAAQYCEAHFTAVLYADLWAMEQRSPNETRSNRELQAIMREAYTSIGEPDAVHAFIDPIANRRDYLRFNQSWSHIFLEQDVLPYAQPTQLAECLVNLRLAGQYGLCNSLSKNVTASAASNAIAQYECAWRLCDWSILDDQPSSVTAENQFEQAHYKALHCLQLTDEFGTKLAIGRARCIVIDDLRSASLECTHNVYRHLQRLALVQQIEDFLPLQFQHHVMSSDQATGDTNSQKNIITKWRAQDRIVTSAFRIKETLLAQRITILRSAGVRATRRLQNTFNVPVDVQQTMLLDVAREARHEGELNMAVRYLAVLSGQPALSSQAKSGLWLEDAQLNWLQGDRLLAKRLIQQSLSNTDPESSLSRACALRIYGECLADTQSSDTRTLIDKYLLNSLKLLGTIEAERDPLAARMRLPAAEIGAFVLEHRRRAYESIGKYADQEYGRIGQHMRSAQFMQKRQSVVENQKLVAQMGAEREASRDQKCTRTVLHRNTDIDRKEIAATEAEHSEYLQLAVKYYVCACSMASSTAQEARDGSVIFRIVSLWLANQSEGPIVRELRESFKRVASWQFMAVLPQVAARITNVSGDFGDTVMEIMERCAIDHPQQTIYQILALANAYADDTTASNSTAKPPRVLGATILIDRLKRNEKTMLAVSQMSEMCNALIAFANKDVVDKKHISSKEPIRKLMNLNYVHCPTLVLPISKTANYPQLITVHKWSDVLTMVGGINAPKKVDCLCSNGRTYPQLLKGKDDLRQDAIMQQVFTILNTMLATNRDTRKARLTVKTYRVVPLTQRSGIIEWCANTLPLAVYLAGSSEQRGAHERFHPQDLKPNYCRKVISSYNRDQKPIAEKVAIFKKVCEQFRPALQYFFLERFARPGDWFERRLAYTKSVATTSMVGYILGIGDRHVSNILIDEQSAELVHIDFGIAFEQSKCLPTPETVPFRMTRDLVAAMGCSGVDGIFRRSCERTMDVLRCNKRTIITILEVLLYDPLYAWALTSRQANSRQSMVSSSADDGGVVAGEQKNVMAERALTRLEAKLDGKEEGAASGATETVEAHVELLIAQATNPYNLCRLFEGWQAYL